MTLFEFAELPETHWRLSEVLLKFFRLEQPKFKDAVIIHDEIKTYNFDAYYEYDDSWVVELKGKLYNVLYNQIDRYYSRGRRLSEGIKFKRYYKDGETRKKRTVKCRWDYNYQKPWDIVVRNSGEGKKGDCQIWTVAVCCGITYKESFDHLYANGWREGNARNEFLNNWKDIFKSHGKTFETYWNRWSKQAKELFVGSTVGNITKKLPTTGTFIVSSDCHIFSVVDGVIYDSCFEPNKRVIHVYKVNPIIQ